MTLHVINWAWNKAPMPASEMHGGVGSIYKPMAKLMLIAIADRGGQDEDGNPGYIGDFPALCESIWLHPSMGTRIVHMLIRDRLLLPISDDAISYSGENVDEWSPRGDIEQMSVLLPVGAP